MVNPQAMGEHEEALKLFDRAIAINPWDFRTWYYRGHPFAGCQGNSAACTSRPDEAIRLCEERSSLRQGGKQVEFKRSFSFHLAEKGQTENRQPIESGFFDLPDAGQIQLTGMW